MSVGTFSDTDHLYEVLGAFFERVAERDDEGFVPKASNPRENARRARERAEPAK